MKNDASFTSLVKIKPKKIFVSYAHKDQNKWKELKKYLTLLEKEKLIATWYDSDIVPGTEWKVELQSQISNCDIFLAILSIDYLNSNCCEWEQNIAINLYDQTGKPIIIPLLLRQCNWETSPLSKFHTITFEGKSLIDSSRNIDNAGTFIEKTFRKMLSSPSQSWNVPGETISIEEQLRNFAENLLGVLHVPDKNYINLTLTNFHDGMPKSLEEVFLKPESSENLKIRYLIHAESGSGKTTMLKYLARKLLFSGKSDDPIPLYLHLSELKDKTVTEALQKKLTANGSQLGARLHELLVNLQDKNRLLFLFDGLDQVENGDQILFKHDLSHSNFVVATRTPSEANLSYYHSHSLTVWEVDPVTPTQATEYLKSCIRKKVIISDLEQWIDSLRKQRTTRKMLRHPLFLEILSSVYDPCSSEQPSTANLIGLYWDRQIIQENEVRKAARKPLIDQNSSRKLKKCLADCAWQLALNGFIERCPVHETQNYLESYQKLYAQLEFDRFYFATYTSDEFHFRHQSFQAYLSAWVIGLELLLIPSSWSVLPRVLQGLAERYPEHFHPETTDPQLSFWLEVFDFVPDVFWELTKTNESTHRLAWEEKIWALVEELANQGLFLLAWRVILQAQEREDINLSSYGNGWREIIWQIVRYRRDSENHFPSDTQSWHYDPLPLAVAKMDDWGDNKKNKALRNGLAQALNKLQGPLIQTLGMYELMLAYLDWQGTDQKLDQYRILFVIGDHDGIGRLKRVRKRFLDDRELYSGCRYILFGRSLPTSVPEVKGQCFGRWLQEKIRSSDANEKLRNIIAKFSSDFYEERSNPHENDFCEWIGKEFVQAVISNEVISTHVSLRMFDYLWTKGINEDVEKLSTKDFNKLQVITRRNLKSSNIKRLLMATVLLGGIANRIKYQENALNKFKEPTWKLFKYAIGKGDIELAYTGYHEAARFQNESEMVVELQQHIKRYYAQELRWHDLYVQGDQIQFDLDRIGSNSPYPRKRWHYCFDAPILLEHGTNEKRKNVNTVLNEFNKQAKKQYEIDALTWARNAVCCLRNL